MTITAQNKNFHDCYIRDVTDESVIYYGHRFRRWYSIAVCREDMHHVKFNWNGLFMGYNVCDKYNVVRTEIKLVK